MSTTRSPLIIKMEPFHYNDFFDFLRCIEAYRFITRHQKDDIAIREGQVKMGRSAVEPIIGDDLMYEKSEVIGDGKGGFTGITAYEGEYPLPVCLESGFFASRF